MPDQLASNRIHRLARSCRRVGLRNLSNLASIQPSIHPPLRLLVNPAAFIVGYPSAPDASLQCKTAQRHVWYSLKPVRSFCCRPCFESTRQSVGSIQEVTQALVKDGGCLIRWCWSCDKMADLFSTRSSHHGYVRVVRPVGGLGLCEQSSAALSKLLGWPVPER